MWTRLFLDATDPILIEDLDGRVIDMNREAERVYGWPRDELLGMPIKTIVPQERHGQADELLRRCRGGEEVRNVEGLRITRDGVVVPVLLTLSRLTGDDGESVAMATFAKDIGALKAAEAQVRAYSRELEQRVEARTAELNEAMHRLEEVNARLGQELEVARERSRSAAQEDALVLAGESIPVRALREGIVALSESSEPVLLSGPPGAGQAAVARSIHYASARADRPFIFVDCALLANVDDTLLGLRSSDEQPRGKLGLAAGGTLYLKSIDALPPATQTELVALLRQAAEQRAAGLAPEPDIRYVAYTSKDLHGLVEGGRFSRALERLLGARRLAVPSLAERRDDIPELGEAMAVRRARSLGRVLDGLADDALPRLLAYNWPGNVDELRNVIERALVLSRSRRVDIPQELFGGGGHVGGYTLQDRLGVGGMGEVWLARHSLLSRPAAVKLIRSDLGELEPEQRTAMLRRFEREARVTAGLRSPHTVELYDFGTTEEGAFYYVMEFLEGIDLQRLVSGYGPLPPGRAVHLLTQICLSLGEAHDAGLVHRDIKPSNILTCHLGPHYDFAKVLDFGIVRVAKGGDSFATETGMLMGTPAFMAPEVTAGKKADVRADIYALGCVAFWMLTGTPVFDAPTPMAMLLQHYSTPPPKPSTVVSGVPPELDRIIGQCLAKEPSERPQSAFMLRELLIDLPGVEPWTERHARQWWRDRSAPSRGEEAASPTLPEVTEVERGRHRE